MQARLVCELPGAIAKAGENIFVDTNVWKCLTYTKATMSYQAKANAYASFINRCVKEKAHLCSSVLSYTELASIIERTERDIYNQSTGSSVSLKKFREGVTERQQVVAELQAAWAQVETLSSLIPIALDDALLKAAQKNFEHLPLDGYDVFFVEQMRAANITSIVTDDLDFIYVPGLTVYTNNADCIGRARMYKKLAN